MNRPIPSRRETAHYVDILFYVQLALLILGAVLGLFSGFGADISGPQNLADIVGELAVLYALYRLAPVEPMLRRAFCAGLGAVVLMILSAVLEAGGANELLQLILLLVQGVVSLLAVYYEFHGLGLLSLPLEPQQGPLIGVTLADKWASIWKWYLGLFFVLMGAAVLAFLLPMAAILAAFISVIGMLVIQIWEARLLYQTANALRCAPEIGPFPPSGGPV